MQRLHLADLVGHILEKESWVHLNLPAIAPTEQIVDVGPGRTHRRSLGDVLHLEREPREVLDHMREILGSYAFSAQYLQEPVPVEGNLIQWEWFQFYKELPHNHDAWIVQSWDTASKSGELNDYSVCSTLAIVEKHYYLLDVFRKRLGFPALRQAVIQQAQKRPVRNIVIEDMGAGTGLIQDLQTGRPPGVPRPEAFKPEGEKVIRMGTQTAKIEAGRVHLPREAVWLREFREELIAFPHGRHDDQVDSVSQFLAWVERRQRKTLVTSRLYGR